MSKAEEAAATFESDGLCLPVKEMFGCLGSTLNKMET
jgi:hypothetical protein